MDERLRRLSRQDDPLALAQGALRSGSSAEARRIAHGALEFGNTPVDAVLEWLEAQIPLPELLGQELDLLGQLLPSAAWETLLPIRLLSACDLRCDRALQAWLRSARGAGDIAPQVSDLLALRGLDRWQAGVACFGAAALVHAEPTPDEALRLARTAQTHEQPLALALELTLLYLLSAGRSDAPVQSTLEGWTPRSSLAQAELDLARHGPQRGPRASLAGTDLPWRPDWIPYRAPLELRDQATLSLHRRLLEGGLVARACADAPALFLVGFVDLHGFRSQNGRIEADRAILAVSEALREHLGDRALRTSHEEWLVAWEGRAPLERARALVADREGEGAPAIRVVIDRRPGPLATRVRRLERGLTPRDGMSRAAQVLEVDPD